MLTQLEHSPLRDAFKRVTETWSRSPVWGLWRSVSRHAIVAQMLNTLHNGSLLIEGEKPFAARVEAAARARFSPSKTTQELLRRSAHYENIVAEFASMCLAYLRTCWAWSFIEEQGKHEEPVQAETAEDQRVRYTSDFVALQLCNYFIYVVRQLQRIAWGIMLALLLVIVVLNSYSAQSPLFVGRFVAIAFLIVGGFVVWVFAGMERNWVLSTISHTEPGELNAEFWLQILGMGTLPLIGVLIHLFPAMATFLSSWIAPSVDSVR